MYKITIKKIESVDFVSRDWRKLREPFKDENDDTYDGDRKNPQFGYAEAPSTKEVVTKVFEITLDDMDVSEVAKKILEK